MTHQPEIEPGLARTITSQVVTPERSRPPRPMIGALELGHDLFVRLSRYFKLRLLSHTIVVNSDLNTISKVTAILYSDRP